MQIGSIRGSRPNTAFPRGGRSFTGAQTQ